MSSCWRRNILLLLAGVAPLASVVTCSPARYGAGTIVFTSGDDDDFDDFFDDDDGDFFDDDDFDDLFD